MTNQEIIALAESEGFEAAFIATELVPIKPEFRVFCEENRCGQYAANYSCPPTCGSVEEMHEKILAGKTALVLKSAWKINGYEDKAGIRNGKVGHNRAMLRLNDALREKGSAGYCIGGSCCTLCDRCLMSLGKPCPQPDRRFSCMSAYCVDVAELAARCGMDFKWDTQLMSIYSMIILK